jgi:hypothetical protein
VTAHYPGDATFAASDSTPPISVVVSPEPSTTTVKALTADVNGNPIPFTSGPYGGFVYIRADVAGQSGNGTATGTVTIKDNSTAITGSPFALNSQGNTATQSGIFTLSTGPHAIGASYGGDASFHASGATPVNITITLAPTFFQAVFAGTMGILNSPYPLSAVFNADSCGVPPTGTVTFFTGATPVATSPIQVEENGCSITATVNATTTKLLLGVNSITAKYNGDLNYSTSTSQPSTTDIVIPTTTTVTSSNLTIQQGQSVTFTATVAANQSGGPALTGNVQFNASSGTTLCSMPVSGGQIQCTSKALPAGALNVFAVYSGDTNYQTSAANVAETVNPGPDFSVAASPASITVASPGQSGSTSLMLTAMNGLTGTFSLVPQCLALPSESTCAVSPASVTFSSAMMTATVMLTVGTRAPSSVPAGRRFHPADNRSVPIFVIGIFALLSLLVLRRGRRGIQVAFTVVTFAALLTFAACGGGGGGVHDPGTPVGLDSAASVSFTIGTATHAVPISINVQ